MEDDYLLPLINLNIPSSLTLSPFAKRAQPLPGAFRKIVFLHADKGIADALHAVRVRLSGGTGEARVMGSSAEKC